jgi:hypothetical protein
MELNHMKKELRQPTSTPNNFSNPQNYHLGTQKTTDVVNESRIDRQLPGFSNNVNVSTMSFNQGFQNPSSQHQPRGYPQQNTRNMTNNSFYNDNSSYGTLQNSRQHNNEMKNSFNNQHGLMTNQSTNFSRRPVPNPMQSSNTYGNLNANPSREYQSNSFGMGNPPRYQSNSMSNNHVDVRVSNQIRGPPPSNSMQTPNPSMNRGPGQPPMNRGPGQPSMEEVEKGQLEQFSKFLISKKNDIEDKLRRMPKVCRRVADKREKLQLNKELDEVTNELEYVKGLIHGP